MGTCMGTTKGMDIGMSTAMHTDVSMGTGKVMDTDIASVMGIGRKGWYGYGYNQGCG